MKEKLLSDAYPFWERLSAEERAELLQSATLVSYRKGECVHRSDMGCTGAVLVLSGLLRVYIVSEEGREVTLFRIRQGEPCVLAASCLLDAIQFDLVIEAAEAAEAVVIPAGVLRPIMESNPYVGLYMYRQATERFSEVMWMMQQILFMGADRRVAIFLWEETAGKGQRALRMTQDEIARNIGSAREVVSRVLKYLAEEGAVSLGRGLVELRDPEKLRKLFE
ncbi:Crp/Fnr family transcriptional regulator [Oscillospiraceae bacterium 50-60]